MLAVAKLALVLIPDTLRNEPVFLSTDDTIVVKFGKHFEQVSILHDHALHAGKQKDGEQDTGRSAERYSLCENLPEALPLDSNRIQWKDAYREGGDAIRIMSSQNGDKYRFETYNNPFTHETKVFRNGEFVIVFPEYTDHRGSSAQNRLWCEKGGV